MLEGIAVSMLTVASITIKGAVVGFVKYAIWAISTYGSMKGLAMAVKWLIGVILAV